MININLPNIGVYEIRRNRGGAPVWSKIQLNQALRPLIEAIESVLKLDKARRKRTILHIVLNRADPLAKELATDLASLLALKQVVVYLGET